MVIFSKRDANRLFDLLYNYETEKKDDEVFRAVENMKEFFKTNDNNRHIDLIEHYFKDYDKYTKTYTEGGLMRHLCDNVLMCSHTSGYSYLEDVINRFGYELAKLNYF